MPTWATIIRRMQLQRGSSASSCNLDTTPIQFPREMPKKLRSQEEVETAVRWRRVDTTAAFQRWGSTAQPQARHHRLQAGLPGGRRGLQRGILRWREGSAAGGGGSVASGNHLARPSSATFPGSPYSVCGQCLPGQGPRRRRLEQSHLTCPLQARGLRASLAQPWRVPTAARADFPARLPVPPSPARPEVALDTRAASGSGVTAEAPG